MTKSIIIKNLLIIIVFLISLSIFYIFLKFILNLYFKIIENGSIFISSRLTPRLKRTNKIIVFLEVLFLISLILFIFFSFWLHVDVLIIAPFFIAFVFLSGTIIRDLKRRPSSTISLLENISKRVNTNNYFVNRFILLLDQMGDIFILLIPLEITYLIIFNLEWPHLVYFFGLLILPLYSTLWIYFTPKLRFQALEVINIRRLVAYCLIAINVLTDTYNKFNNFIDVNYKVNSDDVSFILQISGIIFIAFENFLKVWIDDYLSFVKRNQ